MQDSLIIKKVFDRTINGRRFVIMRHYYPDWLDEPILNNWYCGYMQLNPATDSDVIEAAERDGGEADEILPSAIGGITWYGDLPQGKPSDGYYVGFDTAHFGMQDITLKEVEHALMSMGDEIEKYESEKK